MHFLHQLPGVEFRWYNKAEYSALSSDQKQELYQWQQSKDGQAQIKKSKDAKDKKGGGPKKSNATNRLKSQISSMEKQLKSVASRLSTIGDDSMVSDIAAAIADNAPATRQTAVTHQSPNTNPRNDYTAAAVAIQGILKRKRANSE